MAFPVRGNPSAAFVPPLDPDLLIKAATGLCALSLTCSTIALGQLAYALQSEALPLADRKKLILDSMESSKIAETIGLKTLQLIELAKKIKANHCPGTLPPPNLILVNVLMGLPAANFMVGLTCALGIHALEQKAAEKRASEIQVRKEILQEELERLKNPQTHT